MCGNWARNYERSHSRQGKRRLEESLVQPGL